MKQLVISLAIAAIVATLSAQVPQAFNYQAILRNSDGTVKANETVAVQLEIVDGEDVRAYMEIHNTKQANLGL